MQITPKNTDSKTSLTGPHLRTYNAIFRHPVSRNLNWHDVTLLFRLLGSVEEKPDGELTVMRNGESLVLRPPRTKDVVETEELMAVRHFLERSEPEVTAANGTNGHDTGWLLVINHREARTFRIEMRDSVPRHVPSPESADRVRPARRSKRLSRGQGTPSSNGRPEPANDAPQSGGPVLVLGCGTGMGSETEQFVAWAKILHPEFGIRIVGSLVIDGRRPPEGRLLAKAREFYARARAV